MIIPDHIASLLIREAELAAGSWAWGELLFLQRNPSNWDTKEYSKSHPAAEREGHNEAGIFRWTGLCGWDRATLLMHGEQIVCCK